jgi:hypothetical protein
MQYIYFKESERDQFGDINKWQETYILWCFVTNFI